MRPRGAARWSTKLGRLDILVNNAGEQHPDKDITDISEEQLKRTFQTNIFSMFFLTQAARPHLKKGAAIVNCTSVTMYQGSKELLDYSATKGAITAFTRSLSENLVGEGIRVNAVAPGPIWTPLNPCGGSPPEKMKDFGKNTPMGRPGQPNEVAPSFLFLACEDSQLHVGPGPPPQWRDDRRQLDRCGAAYSGRDQSGETVMRALSGIIGGLVAGFVAIDPDRHRRRRRDLLGARRAWTLERRSRSSRPSPACRSASKLAMMVAWFGGGLVGALVAKLIARSGLGGLDGRRADRRLCRCSTSSSCRCPAWMQALSIAAPLLGGLIGNHLVEAARAAESTRAVDGRAGRTA